jgi:ATP-dependent DNA helicase RecQ
MIRDVYQFFLNEVDENYEVHRTLDEIKDAIGAKNGMAVGAALGSLIRGRWVERFDVPGMRAKGTRLLKPDVLTRDLTLDEAALEEKERRDREKLEKMVQLCYANTCRQQWVLEYFGEVDAPVCGSCDVCRGEENSERRAPSDEENLIVRKFLSGVARMSRRTPTGWEGIFGRGRIVQMLLGSKSQEVLRVRLHELKTYGILKKQGTAYLNALARSLNSGGLIVTQMGEYPLVTLTPRGEQVMMGKTSYSLEWPSNDGGSKTSAEGVDLQDLGFDGQLYDRLKDVRTRLAKAAQVPAYVIFPNNTLEHLARLRPKTMDAGLLVKGIGEAKAEKYLEPFLKVIRQVDQGE